MIEWLKEWVSPDIRELLLVLAASFVIGLSMEGRKAEGKRFSPGGVRTYPLICLGGYLLSRLGELWHTPLQLPFLVGLGVLGLLVAMLYRGKISREYYGMTTEVFVMITYVMGGLVAAHQWWLVAALTVLMVLLQELKDPLERLVTHMDEHELVTIAKFVLITAVILPVVPNESLAFTVPTRPELKFALNPRHIWWVVVAVAAVSYASYLVQRFFRKGRHGLLLTGLLGGAYSSTVTTIALSRRARGDGPGAVAAAGSILAASGVMYLRLLALVAIFGWALARQLAWPLVACAVVGLLVGSALCLLGRKGDGEGEAGPLVSAAASPLELRAAFGFALVFVVIILVTRAATQLLGDGGTYGVAVLSGLGVVDPFVLSLTQGRADMVGRAALAVMLAASANNVAKGLYAAFLASRRTGLLALSLLAGMAGVTMVAWYLCVIFGVTAPAW